MTIAGAARHDLLRLTEAGWSALLKRRPDLATVPGIALWAEQGHPVMVRRRQPGDATALLPVAIALPLAHGRARFGFQVAAGEVASLRPPPSLRELTDEVVPDEFRELAASVLSEADRLGLVPRVFGSVMWQCVTELAYLRDGSDLDLVWPIARGEAACLPALLAALERLGAGRGPGPSPGIDGEIVLEGVGAVQWRELARGGTAELLVKTPEAVALMPRTRFLSLAATSC